MSRHLRVVQGGRESASGDSATEPDRRLFALIEEARMLESRDRVFNRRIEQLIRDSDEWLSGDREAAVNSLVVQEVLREHAPVVERLMEIPGQVAESPAYGREALLLKLRYLRSLLEGAELDILDSVIEDLDYQR